jgi:hypothetical protein
MSRLLAGALFNVNAASGGEPLQAAAIRTAGTAHIVVINGCPLPGDSNVGNIHWRAYKPPVKPLGRGQGPRPPCTSSPPAEK